MSLLGNNPMRDHPIYEERKKLLKEIGALKDTISELQNGSALGFSTLPDCPKWEPADAAAWRAFLATPVGQKLKATVQFNEQAKNRTAVLLGGEKQSGEAAGWHKASVHYFETLSVHVPPQEDAATEQGAGDSPLRERMAP